MQCLTQVFSNREIAMGIWIVILIFAFIFFRLWRNAIINFIKQCIPILLNIKIIIPSILGIIYFLYSLHILKKLDIWDIGLLKDTIFWMITVNIPLFIEAACNKDGNKYFKDIMKDNLKLVLVFEFLFNNWSFGIITEFILFPIMLVVTICFMYSSENKKLLPISKLCSGILVFYAICVIINGIYSLFDNPTSFFSIDTLKAFVLPTLLVFLNLPYLYSVALYSKYDILFIRIKSSKKQKNKMKLVLLFYGKFNLTRVTNICKNLADTLLISENPQELKRNLNMIEKRMNSQIGDVYMNRSNYYLKMFIFIIVISLLGIICINFTNSFKDLIDFKFNFDIEKLKTIFTYILASSISFSIGALIFSWGLRKKKYEEISNIKKFAMYDFLLALNHQIEKIECDDMLDNPVFIYDNYVVSANQLLNSMDKVLSDYENLLTTYERENIEITKSKVLSFLYSFYDKDGNFYNDEYQLFIHRYKNKYINCESEIKKGNLILLKSSLKEYKKMLNNTYEIFKKYY